MGRRRYDDENDLDIAAKEISDATRRSWAVEREQRIAAHERRVEEDLHRLGLWRNSGTGCRGTALCGDQVGDAARARSA